MSIKRTIMCDVCGVEQAEHVADQGWPNWGAVHGIAFNGVATPNVCPSCLADVMDFLEERKNGVD